MVPIRRLLLKDLLVLMGTVVAVVCGMAWFSLTRVVEQEALDKARLGLHRIQGDLKGHFERMEALARSIESLWATGVLDEQDPEAMDRLLHPLLKNTPQVASLAFWGTSGRGMAMIRRGLSQSHLTPWSTQVWVWREGRCWGRWTRRDDTLLGPGEPWGDIGINPGERPWYKETVTRGRSGWVEPYTFMPDLDPGLSYGIPIRGPEGRFRGVLILDLRLDDLAPLVWGVQPTPHAQAFVADGQGRILILPREGTAESRRQAYLKPLSESFHPLGFQILRQTPGPLRPRILSEEGQASLTLQTPLDTAEGIHWNLGLAIPLEDVADAAHRQKQLLLVVMGATLALVVWRANALARRFGEPLAQMAQAARHLASGAVPNLSPTSVSELGALGEMLHTASEAIRTRAHLEQQVEQSQRLETVGTLAGGVAHDVNNQLLAIQGQLDLVKGDLPPGHAGLGRIAKAETAIQRCAQMVKSLLAFSHHAKPELRPMDLNEVVRDTAALLERVLGGRIQVACELSPQPAAILGEPVQIEQVLLNLGVNARDAMPEGGRLTFTTRIAAGGWVDLDITDTGAGIPEAHLPHIFEPFFTTKEVGKGTGLGLSMVFGVVTAHQGTITVTSAPGQGTTFHLHLPGTLAFSTEERVRLLEPPELHPTSGLRVLVVDDEPAIREILAESLSLMDLEVVTACDGEDAWRHFQAGSFDLVISDQRMPLCMGTELLARIRATGSQVPFILSSGHGLEGIEAELERDAQVRILPKPFQLKQMTNLAGQLTRLG